MPNRYKVIIKLVSTALIAAFGLHEIAWAAPIAPAAPAVSASVLADVIRDPARLAPPSDALTVRETHAGTNGKLILHIQDPHTNFSGQKSLASGLGEWMDRYSVNWVLVEGADREVTLSDLRGSAGPDAWKRVAYPFLMRGEMAGEEYLNLTSDRPMRLLGIEDENLYRQALVAYAAIASARESALEDLRRIRSAVQTLKRRMYPKELSGYETAVQAAGETSPGSTDRLIALSEASGVGLEDLSALEAYRDVKRREASIDFDAANREQAELLSDLHAQPLKPGAGPQAQYAHWSGLRDAAKRSGVPFRAGGELDRVIAYLGAVAALDAGLWMDQARQLEDRVFAKLLTTPEQATLRLADVYTALCEKSLRLQLSSSEHKAWKKLRSNRKTEQWAAFLNRQLLDAGLSDEWIPISDTLDRLSPVIEDFYAAVDRRDEAFMRKTREYLDSGNADAAFLIAGGYHTENLTRLLRAAGYSYAVLTPRVTDETDHAAYESVLLADAAATAAARSMTMRPRALPTSPVRFARLNQAARLAFADRPSSETPEMPEMQPENGSWPWWAKIAAGMAGGLFAGLIGALIWGWAMSGMNPAEAPAPARPAPVVSAPIQQAPAAKPIEPAVEAKPDVPQAEKAPAPVKVEKPVEANHPIFDQIRAVQNWNDLASRLDFWFAELKRPGVPAHGIRVFRERWEELLKKETAAARATYQIETNRSDGELQRAQSDFNRVEEDPVSTQIAKSDAESKLRELMEPKMTPAYVESELAARRQRLDQEARNMFHPVLVEAMRRLNPKQKLDWGLSDADFDRILDMRKAELNLERVRRNDPDRDEEDRREAEEIAAASAGDWNELEIRSFARGLGISRGTWADPLMDAASLESVIDAYLSELEAAGTVPRKLVDWYRVSLFEMRTAKKASDDSKKFLDYLREEAGRVLSLAVDSPELLVPVEDIHKTLIIPGVPSAGVASEQDRKGIYIVPRWEERGSKINSIERLPFFVMREVTLPRTGRKVHIPFPVSEDGIPKAARRFMNDPASSYRYYHPFTLEICGRHFDEEILDDQNRFVAGIVITPWAGETYERIIYPSPALAANPELLRLLKLDPYHDQTGYISVAYRYVVDKPELARMREHEARQMNLGFPKAFWLKPGSDPNVNVVHTREQFNPATQRGGEKVLTVRDDRNGYIPVHFPKRINGTIVRDGRGGIVYETALHVPLEYQIVSGTAMMVRNENLEFIREGEVLQEMAVIGGVIRYDDEYWKRHRAWERRMVDKGYQPFMGIEFLKPTILEPGPYPYLRDFGKAEAWMLGNMENPHPLDDSVSAQARAEYFGRTMVANYPDGRIEVFRKPPMIQAIESNEFLRVFWESKVIHDQAREDILSAIREAEGARLADAGDLFTALGDWIQRPETLKMAFAASFVPILYAGFIFGRAVWWNWHAGWAAHHYAAALKWIPEQGSVKDAPVPVRIMVPGLARRFATRPESATLRALVGLQASGSSGLVSDLGKMEVSYREAGAAAFDLWRRSESILSSLQDSGWVVQREINPSGLAFWRYPILMWHLKAAAEALSKLTGEKSAARMAMSQREKHEREEVAVRSLSHAEEGVFGIGQTLIGVQMHLESMIYTEFKEFPDQIKHLILNKTSVAKLFTDYKKRLGVIKSGSGEIWHLRSLRKRVQTIQGRIQTHLQDHLSEKGTNDYNAATKGLDEIIQVLQSRLRLQRAARPVETVDLRDVLKRAYAATSSSKNYPASILLEEPLLFRGDRISATSAVFNLMINAWRKSKQTTDKYDISIYVREVPGKTGSFHEIEIRNKGMIPDAFLEMDLETPGLERKKIFNLGVSETSTGIGTTEAYYAVRDLDGTVDAFNDAERGEAVFVVRIPALQADPAGARMARQIEQSITDNYVWERALNWLRTEEGIMPEEVAALAPVQLEQAADPSRKIEMRRVAGPELFWAVLGQGKPACTGIIGEEDMKRLNLPASKRILEVLGLKLVAFPRSSPVVVSDPRVSSSPRGIFAYEYYLYNEAKAMRSLQPLYRQWVREDAFRLPAEGIMAAYGLGEEWPAELNEFVLQSLIEMAGRRLLGPTEIKDSILGTLLGYPPSAVHWFGSSRKEKRERGKQSNVTLIKDWIGNNASLSPTLSRFLNEKIIVFVVAPVGQSSENMIQMLEIWVKGYGRVERAANAARMAQHPPFLRQVLKAARHLNRRADRAWRRDEPDTARLLMMHASALVSEALHRTMQEYPRLTSLSRDLEKLGDQLILKIADTYLSDAHLSLAEIKRSGTDSAEIEQAALEAENAATLALGWLEYLAEDSASRRNFERTANRIWNDAEILRLEVQSEPAAQKSDDLVILTTSVRPTRSSDGASRMGEYIRVDLAPGRYQGHPFAESDVIRVRVEGEGLPRPVQLLIDRDQGQARVRIKGEDGFRSFSQKAVVRIRNLDDSSSVSVPLGLTMDWSRNVLILENVGLQPMRLSFIPDRLGKLPSDGRPIELTFDPRDPNRTITFWKDGAILTLGWTELPSAGADARVKVESGDVSWTGHVGVLLQDLSMPIRPGVTVRYFDIETNASILERDVRFPKLVVDKPDAFTIRVANLSPQKEHVRYYIGSREDARQIAVYRDIETTARQLLDHELFLREDLAQDLLSRSRRAVRFVLLGQSQDVHAERHAMMKIVRELIEDHDRRYGEPSRAMGDHLRQEMEGLDLLGLHSMWVYLKALSNAAGARIAATDMNQTHLNLLPTERHPLEEAERQLLAGPIAKVRHVEGAEYAVQSTTSPERYFVFRTDGASADAETDARIRSLMRMLQDSRPAMQDVEAVAAEWTAPQDWTDEELAGSAKLKAVAAQSSLILAALPLLEKHHRIAVRISVPDKVLDAIAARLPEHDGLAEAIRALPEPSVDPGIARFKIVPSGSVPAGENVLTYDAPDAGAWAAHPGEAADFEFLKLLVNGASALRDIRKGKKLSSDHALVNLIVAEGRSGVRPTVAAALQDLLSGLGDSAKARAAALPFRFVRVSQLLQFVAAARWAIQSAA